MKEYSYNKLEDVTLCETNQVNHILILRKNHKEAQINNSHDNKQTETMWICDSVKVKIPSTIKNPQEYGKKYFFGLFLQGVKNEK